MFILLFTIVTNITFICYILQSYQSISSMQQQDLRAPLQEAFDTKKPMDISEEEELERISALLQRDNLVRGLGIVEHVYR